MRSNRFVFNCKSTTGIHFNLPVYIFDSKSDYMCFMNHKYQKKKKKTFYYVTSILDGLGVSDLTAYFHFYANYHLKPMLKGLRGVAKRLCVPTIRFAGGFHHCFGWGNFSTEGSDRLLTARPDTSSCSRLTTNIRRSEQKRY